MRYRYLRYLTLTLMITAVLVWSLALGLEKPYLKIVFCDVGQGDAILISYGYSNLLIDGGPGRRVIECLEKHLYTGDKTIEAVVLTHPQADHMEGLLQVLDRYRVEKFLAGVEGNKTLGFARLKGKIEEERIPFIPVYTGDRLRVVGVDGLEALVIWPERDWVSGHLLSGTDAAVLGASTDGTDLNSFSVGLLVSYGRFRALFTGDADTQIESAILSTGLLGNVDVFKIPHHGSKSGLSTKLLSVINPSVGVISVGKSNTYGHPAPELIKMLGDYRVETYRTDRDGEVVVRVEETGWLVESSGSSGARVE